MVERVFIAVALIATAALAWAWFSSVQRARASSAIRGTSQPAAPLLLYFRSSACAPCATQGRFIDQLDTVFGGRVVIKKIDADAERQLAERYGVFTVPTTLVIDRHGTVRHANYGLADARKLAAQLQAVVMA